MIHNSMTLKIGPKEKALQDLRRLQERQQRTAPKPAAPPGSVPMKAAIAAVTNGDEETTTDEVLAAVRYYKAHKRAMQKYRAKHRAKKK